MGTRATIRPNFGHMTPRPFRDFASARAIAPPSARPEPALQWDKSLIETHGASVCPSAAMPLNVSLQVCDEATTAGTRSIAFCSASATTGPTSRSASSLKAGNLCKFTTDIDRVSGPEGQKEIHPRLILRAWRVTVCREVEWALFSAAQPQGVHRGHHTHRGRPPAPRSLLCRNPASFLWFRTPLLGFLAPNPRRQPTSAKSRLTTPMWPMSLSQTPRIEDIRIYS